MQAKMQQVLLQNSACMPTSFIAPGKRNIAFGFDIYRNNIKKTSFQSFALTFPNTLKITGEEFFATMVSHYIEEYPSKFTNLNAYGADFPLFIANYSADTAMPYLSDLAYLEWAMHLAWIGADTKELDIAKIFNMSPELLVLYLQLNASLLSSNYEIDAIWQWCQNDGIGQSPNITKDKARYYCVWRRYNQVSIDILSYTEYLLLQQLTGDNLVVVAEKLLAKQQDIDLKIILPKIVAKGYCYLK